MSPIHTSRALTRLTTFIALAITLLPPLGYFLIEREGLVRSLAADAKVQAISISGVVGRNPGIWEEAHERLLEATEPILEEHRALSIFNRDGHLVTARRVDLRWPSVVRAEEFFDSSHVIGKVEVGDSLSNVCVNAMLVLAVSALLGFLVYVPLRQMPARALKRAAESLVRGQLNRSLVDGLESAVVLTDDQMRVIAANKSATCLAILSRPITQGVNLVECFHGAYGDDKHVLSPEQLPMRRCLDEWVSIGPMVVGLELGSGQRVWFSITCTPIKHGEDGELPAIVTSIEDVTERKRIEDRLLITERALQSSRDAIMITDENSLIVSINDAFRTIIGYECDEAIGQPASLLRSGRHTADFYKTMWSEITTRGSWSGEIWNRRKTGEIFPAWLSISQIRNSHGAVTHHLGTLFDLTERIKAEEEFRHLARHDPLTGLPNRTQLRESLGHALAAAERHSWRVGVFFIDIDRFKLINDTLGHEAGDAVLLEVSARLKSVLRGEDVVARLAGDEFIVFVTNFASDASLVTVAENILESMSRAFVYCEKELFVTTSVGVVVYPQDGADVDTLISNADTAMYVAKGDGRANFKFFTSTMNDASRHHLEITRAVMNALQRNEFILHYQPQVLACDGHAVVGAEALIRWNHPDRGMVPPGEFIPIIEGTRLIIDVGNWVIDTAGHAAGA